MFCQQSPEWELLFKTLINKSRLCPAISLCSNNLITPENVDNAAGNHVFDDHYEFWEITQQEGHWIRSVFQTHSIRRDPEFKAYIQGLIDEAPHLLRKYP